MSTYPPKLDKARKEWLNSLPARAEVALLHPTGKVYGLCHVDRRDGEFWEVVPMGHARRVFTAGSGKNKSGWYILPITPELRREDDSRRLRARVCAVRWGDVPDEQIEAIAKILGWDATPTT